MKTQNSTATAASFNFPPLLPFSGRRSPSANLSPLTPPTIPLVGATPPPTAAYHLPKMAQDANNLDSSFLDEEGLYLPSARLFWLLQDMGGEMSAAEK